MNDNGDDRVAGRRNTRREDSSTHGRGIRKSGPERGGRNSIRDSRPGKSAGRDGTTGRGTGRDGTDPSRPWDRGQGGPGGDCGVQPPPEYHKDTRPTAISHRQRLAATQLQAGGTAPLYYPPSRGGPIPTLRCGRPTCQHLEQLWAHPLLLSGALVYDPATGSSLG